MAGTLSLLTGQADWGSNFDGPRSVARLLDPSSVAADPMGNAYIATSQCVVKRVDAAGEVSTVAGAAGTPGSANGIGAAARFILPWAIASDPAGNVYVGDAFDFTVRKIAVDGTVTTVAGVSGFGRFTPGAAPGGLELVLSLAVSGNKLHIGQPQSIAVLEPRP